MKLLIADDETLTRQGIISCIDWDSLGITEIYQADDGVHGLELAKAVKPDIVLSDVRMPRLDGIGMSIELKKLFPGINIIFMSGYSDKEYLKAAIKLKAISYVEKPIDPAEIEEAVMEVLKNKQTQEETSSTMRRQYDFAASSLALSLIYPNTASKEELLLHFQELGLSLPEATDCHTLLFFFKNSVSMVPKPLLEQLEKDFHELLTAQGLMEVHGIKQERYIIYHIWGTPPFEQTLEQLGASAATMVASLQHDFFAVFGKCVHDITKLYESYNHAVLQLQKCFYYPYGTVFLPTDQLMDLGTFSSIPAALEDFKSFLHRKDQQVFAMAQTILDSLGSAKNVLPNHVKDYYYQLISAIHETYHLLQLPLPEQHYAVSDPFETVFHCGTLNELDELLQKELSLFFAQAERFHGESTPVTAIKNFIAAHYQDDTLSIKDISDHVFLSTSYICTIFKTETGQTLNQYITKYRVEKAKRLLADPRYKVSDISSKVGYSDGNYFGKTFKKIVGLSPTEYREQVSGL